MIDLVFYTSKEKLLHKRGLLENDPDHSESGEYYWSMTNIPKLLSVGSRAYFATNKAVQGYFIICEVVAPTIIERAANPGLFQGFVFRADSWVQIDPLPCKSFQGFCYAKNLKGLK